MISGSFPILSKYLLVAGLLLNLALLLAFVFNNFVSSSLLVKHTKRNKFSACLFLLFLLLMILSGFQTFKKDIALIWLSIPYFAVSLVISASYLWFLMQLGDSEKLSIEVLETIVGVIEAGDSNLEGHSLNVHNLSLLLYDYLPWKYKVRIKLHQLQYASLLLDVGKLGIPRNIIQKEGKLNDEEYALIRRHPEIGCILLSPLPNFAAVRSIIKCHHERVDGKGYLHLSKDEIPLASRLLAVTDTFSAITMNRSYRPSLSYGDAIAELRLAAGSQLDSEFVNIFCSIPRKKINECLANAKKKMVKYEAGDFK